MATNLITAIKKFLTPDFIKRIAAALGVDSVQAQTAASAAIPGLVVGVSDLAMQPGGAQNIADFTSQHGSSLMNVQGLLREGHEGSLLETGSGIVNSLLGPSRESALSGALSSFSGLGKAKSSSLLSMLAPAVMGVIAQNTRGLESSGITNYFADQSNNIAAALPFGFSKLLGGTGLFDSVRGLAATATSAANQGFQSATSTISSAARSGANSAIEAVTPKSSYSWLYWAIPIVAVALGLGFFFRTYDASKNLPQSSASRTMMIHGYDVPAQVGDNVAKLRSTLANVTDVESAKMALPQLNALTAEVDKVSRMQFSVDEQKALNSVLKPELQALNNQSQRVLAIPGVAEILKPTLDPLLNTLSDLTT